jgi:RecG-like helicase
MNSMPFEKITRKSINYKNNNTELYENSKTIETIKLLGKQIIEIRGIIEEQETIIKSLRKEVQVLKDQNSETEGNIKLSLIDQKDIAKQLRMLKAKIDSSQITLERTQSSKSMENSLSYNSNIPRTEADIKERYFPNYANSSIIEKSNNLKPLERNLPEQPKSIDEVAKQFIFGRMPKLLNLEN